MLSAISHTNVLNIRNIVSQPTTLTEYKRCSKIQVEGLEERCMLPSGVRVPPPQYIWYILSLGNMPDVNDVGPFPNQNVHLNQENCSAECF